MYERLLDKNVSPSEDFIKKYLGTESYHNLLELEKYLNAHYDLKKEIKFPFGNSYGWGYKYSHKSSHLCYAFFESGAFTITLQLGDSCVAAVNKILPDLSAKANELWKNRYHCGKQGGWIHYRVISPDELSDIFSLIAAKKKAAK
ncbi:DUF3788 family protein [Caproicibacterium sp. BJN0003]|uniref:DUF3788 family protein n=1 Tax=Caproicibacterium sp. BJN0003 TaxID=2994078 RepID=UPI00224F25F7|nr:DUF3788 family protein [Caproicibacterium sp. BJN0003]UZT81751.1 DUF3788 family protein [Caproicibacterium sp. BJN0003]